MPRTYLRETPVEVAVAQMGSEARALARLSPWLREQLGVGAGAGEPEPARFGVFDSLTNVLYAAEELGEPENVLPSLPEGRQHEPPC